MIPRLFSTLVPKSKVMIEAVVSEQRFAVEVPTAGGFVPPAVEAEDLPALPAGETVAVPLIRLAVARSGDKGDHSNIGVAARRAEYLPYIKAALSAGAVRDWFAHVLAGGRQGRVERWELPASLSLNFLLYNALGSGGAASLRSDPQGKAFAQMLLDYPIPVPRHLADLLTK
jgi:hypothetical protein